MSSLCLLISNWDCDSDIEFSSVETGLLVIS